MNKFNLPRRNIQKERRQKRTERRKAKANNSKVSCADDSCCGSTAVSLKVASGQGHVGYMSGKNKAKLQKKWRRAQKEALQSGLVTMEDIEMMATDEGSSGADEGLAQPKLSKSARAFSMKKRAKLRVRSSSAKEPVAAPDAGAEGEDAMMQ